MSRRIAILGCAVLVAFAGVGMPMVSRQAVAAPEPSKTPVSWELNFKYGPMERVYATIDGKQEAYWYMRYTVINNTGRDILFTPTFELLADTGTALKAFKEANGKDPIPAAVFDQIKAQYKNPLLLSPNSVFGKLLQGEDNARDGVAIFPAIDPEARDFKLFVMGLSGETIEAINAATDKPYIGDDGKPVIVQKTLELDIKIPGQAVGIAPKSEVTGIKWVMK